MSIQQEIDQLIREKRVYFVGEKLPSDWYEAYRFWLPIAESGDAQAQYNIGRCLSLGDGIDKDESKAIEWFGKAAAQGEPRAHFNLYSLYAEDKDEAKAAEWLAKAVELNETRAVNLSLNKTAMNALLSGSRTKAKDTFKLLVDNGDTNADLGLAACDLEFDLMYGTKSHYYSYTSSVVNGNGGGTRTGSYALNTLVLRVKNCSPVATGVSIWLEMYDSKNRSKKLSADIRLDFIYIQSGEIAEVVHELDSSTEGNLVYVTGYNVHNQGFSKWINVIFLEKVLVWEPKFKAEQTFVGLSFAFFLILCFNVVLSVVITAYVGDALKITQNNAVWLGVMALLLFVAIQYNWFGWVLGKSGYARTGKKAAQMQMRICTGRNT